VNKKKNIKIMIVDDHEIVRHGLRQSIEQVKDFSVIAEADTGRSAIDYASSYFPDIIIMDINMPDLNGMEATKQIILKNPKMKIIGLSMHSDHLYVMGMLNAGASGFLLKTCSFRELSKAIYTVSTGKIYLTPDIAGMVIENAINPEHKKVTSVFSELTSRDVEVLQLVAEGKKSNEIAEELNISKRTVDIHRSNLKKKLSVESVAEMTKLAIREGLTSLY